MSNKINGLDNRPVAVKDHAVTTRTAGKSAAAPGAAVSAAAHEVKLTDSAVQLAALEKALSQVPDVDLKQVEEVRAKIQSGEYKIDAQRIAAKLLQLERALAHAEAGKLE